MLRILDDNVLPFDRVVINRIATTQDHPDDIQLDLGEADTGRSQLTGLGSFTGIYGATSVPGIDAARRLRPGGRRADGRRRRQGAGRAGGDGRATRRSPPT